MKIGPNSDPPAFLLRPDSQYLAIGGEADFGLIRICPAETDLCGQSPAIFGGVAIAPDAGPIGDVLFPYSTRVAFAVEG